MKRHYYAGLLLLSVLGITSCNRHIYAPNAVNVPLLKEKNEFKASISPNNLHTAFAITDNIAIMANGQYVYRLAPWDNDQSTNDLFLDQDLRGGVVEGAVGFFKPLDKKKRMVFDVYAGGGAGGFKTLAAHNTEASANPNDYLLKNRFSKVFIQPSIGFVHPVIEAAFSSRFSMLNFYNSQIGSRAFENNTTAKDDFLRVADKPIVFYEPAFTFRVGYKYVKFQTQLLFSIPLNDENFSQYQTNQYFQQVGFMMGASVNIAHWYDNFRKKR